MASLQTIKLYSHASGPNPWKIVILFEELGLPYDVEYVDFSKIKQEPYISVNPNGRVPAITDPNTGITLWESGAIIQYIIATYDKEHKLSYAGGPEKFYTDQWLFFQVSGQGPYFGQLAWFSNYHSEKLPSAIERYRNEAKRVVGVIDAHLSKTGTTYLVGDKCTYADLSFVPWSQILEYFGLDVYADGKNQSYKAWWDKVNGRPAVQKAAQLKADAMKASAH